MDPSTRLLAQTFSIVAGGLFSWAMIDLVVRDRLKWYLADQKFELLVIAGGVLLAAIVLLKLRAILIPGAGHAHAHEHGEDDHAHEHGSVSLWRYIVLAIPLMIVLMGLAPDGISAGDLENRMTRAQRDAIAAIDAQSLGAGGTGGRILTVDAPELQQAASQSARRDFWQSTTDPVRARIAGEFVPDLRYTDRYRLMRIKITCCAADAAPVGVTVFGPVDPSWKRGDWLEVVGPVQFFEVSDQRTGRSEFYPLIRQEDVRPTTPRVYLQ